MKRNAEREKSIKNKVLNAARTPMCAGKTHMDKKHESKKNGNLKKNIRMVEWI